MENIMTFTGIIVIIFGVLQIILFFKLWGMTDDVKRLKSHFTTSQEDKPEVSPTSNKRSLFYSLVVANEIQKAKIVLCEMISESPDFEQLLRVGFENDYNICLKNVLSKFEKEINIIGENEFDFIRAFKKK